MNKLLDKLIKKKHSENYYKSGRDMNDLRNKYMIVSVTSKSVMQILTSTRWKLPLPANFVGKMEPSIYLRQK